MASSGWNTEPFILLLGNFYAGYLDKKSFDASVVVNDAGIEQLATMGIEKLKQIQQTGRKVYILIVAGLTDMVSKAIEDNKQKLDLTFNAMQLIEQKMIWAEKVLRLQGAVLSWAIIPGVSLKMYHRNEGWNLDRIPGCSPGLEREQMQLSQHVRLYQTLCKKANNHLGVPTAYLTDKVQNESGSLNTTWLQSDGVTPTSHLLDIWDDEIKRFTSRIRRFHDEQNPSFKGFSNLDSKLPQSTSALTASLASRADDYRGLKRASSGSSASSRGLLGLAADPTIRPSRGLLGMADMIAQSTGKGRDIDIDSKRARYDSAQPTSSAVTSLLDLKLLPPVSETTTHSTNVNPEMLMAMQLAMQQGNSTGTAQSGNTWQLMMNLLNMQQQQKKDDELARQVAQRLEEERVLRQRAEEQRRIADEIRIRALRKAEEERAAAIKKQEEIAFMKKKQEEKQLSTIQNAIITARIQAEQIRHTHKLKGESNKEISSSIPSLLDINASSTQSSALDRLNAKLRLSQGASTRYDDFADKSSPVVKDERRNRTGDKNQDSKRLSTKSSKVKVESTPVDSRTPLKRYHGSAFVLFSYTNRNGMVKPLRGVKHLKVHRSDTKTISDNRSRGIFVYDEHDAPAPSLGLLKIKPTHENVLSDFEERVANYNNAFMELWYARDEIEKEVKSSKYKFVERLAEMSKSSSSSIEGKEKPGESNAKGDKSSNTSKTAKEESPNITGKLKTSSNQAHDKAKSCATKRECNSAVQGEAQEYASPNKKEQRERKREEEKPSHFNKNEKLDQPGFSKSGKQLASKAKPRWDHSDSEDEDLNWDRDSVLGEPIHVEHAEPQEKQQADLPIVHPLGSNDDVTQSEAEIDISETPEKELPTQQIVTSNKAQDRSGVSDDFSNFVVSDETELIDEQGSGDRSKLGLQNVEQMQIGIVLNKDATKRSSPLKSANQNTEKCHLDMDNNEHDPQSTLGMPSIVVEKSDSSEVEGVNANDKDPKILLDINSSKESGAGIIEIETVSVEVVPSTGSTSTNNLASDEEAPMVHGTLLVEQQPVVNDHLLPAEENLSMVNCQVLLVEEKSNPAVPNKRPTVIKEFKTAESDTVMVAKEVPLFQVNEPKPVETCKESTPIRPLPQRASRKKVLNKEADIGENTEAAQPADSIVAVKILPQPNEESPSEAKAGDSSADSTPSRPLRQSRGKALAISDSATTIATRLRSRRGDNTQ